MEELQQINPDTLTPNERALWEFLRKITVVRDQALEELARTRTQRDEIAAERDKIAAVRDEYERNHAEDNAELSRVIVERDKYERQAADWYAHAGSLERTLADRTAALKSAEQAKTIAENDAFQSRVRAEAIKANADEELAKHKEHAKNLWKEHREQRDAIRELNAEIERLQKERDAERQSHAVLVRKAGDLEQLNAYQANRIEELDNAFIKAMSRADEETARGDVLHQERNTLRRDLEAARNEIAELKKQPKALAEELRVNLNAQLVSLNDKLTVAGWNATRRSKRRPWW